MSAAEREIAVVVRAFRWLGRLGAVVFGLGAGVWSVELAHSIVSPVRIGGEAVSTAALSVRLFVSLALFVFSVGLLRAAVEMSRRRPEAKRKALVLSALLLPGFPLFTLIGFLCIQRIRRHYDAYCREDIAAIGAALAQEQYPQ